MKRPSRKPVLPGQKLTARTRSTSSSPSSTEAPSGSAHPEIYGAFGEMLASAFFRPPSPQNAAVEINAPVTAKHKKKPENWLVKQPYDAFLVLDVEATCLQGTNFDWPNEIIEWPVCLLRWQDKDKEGRASTLVAVDEFRSFVKPTWRPHLSEFCTSLTGITQADVEQAPKFAKVLASFSLFLAKHGLIDPTTGRRLQRFTWCSDGPFDIRDFVVKQCFISKISMPEWLKGDVLDVRKAVGFCLAQEDVKTTKGSTGKHPAALPRRPSLNISQQLRALGLSSFEGREHSGIDDTRNIARVVLELARRGVRLEPNTIIHTGRRWQWMGSPGQILEEYCLT